MTFITSERRQALSTEPGVDPGSVPDNIPPGGHICGRRGRHGGPMQSTGDCLRHSRAAQWTRVHRRRLLGDARLQTPLARSFLTALHAAFGPHVAQSHCAISFVLTRTEVYRRDGDAYLLRLKKVLGELNQLVLSQGFIPRNTLAQVLPRSLSNVTDTVKLLQFLKLRRGLPRLTDRSIIDQKKQEYLASVTSPIQARPVPHLVGTILGMSISKVEARDRVSHSSAISGSSSCLGFTRRAGGRNAFLHTVKPYTLPPYHERTLIPLFNRIETAASIITTQFRDELSSLAIPSAEVLVVPELGAKLRFVTKSDPRIVALGQLVRQTYFPELKRLRNVSVSEALVDPELGVIAFTGTRKGRLLYSADFSAATDRLSHEVLLMVCRLLEVDPRVIFQGHSVAGLPVTSGAFMGLPASWTLLSMIHYAVARSVDPEHNFRIKGDDLIALWHPHQWLSYVDLAHQVGLDVNEKTAIGRHYGTFCEGDYLLRGVVATRLPTFSLRSFIEDSPLSHAQWSVYVDRGVDIKRLHSLQSRAHRRWVALCSKFKVNRFSPSALGGLDFVPKSLDREVTLTDRALLQRAHDGIQICRPLTEASVGKMAVTVINRINLVRWSVNGTDEELASYDRLTGRSISRSVVTDSFVSQPPPVKVVTPLRRVRNLARYVTAARKLNAGFPSGRMSYSAAYSLLERLRPLPRSVDECYGSVAQTSRRIVRRDRSDHTVGTAGGRH